MNWRTLVDSWYQSSENSHNVHIGITQSVSSVHECWPSHCVCTIKLSSDTICLLLPSFSPVCASIRCISIWQQQSTASNVHTSSNELLSCCTETWKCWQYWQEASVGQQSLCRSTSFTVTDFGTNQKPTCDFLLVINTNLHPTSDRFQVIADYWLNLCFCISL